MRFQALLFSTLIASLGASAAPATDGIPLPEHPRPDFERPHWVNLNGEWAFRFDAANQGLDGGWAALDRPFERRIQVPFPWGAPLSGVEDGADIGWYQRQVEIPPEWEGRRVFLNVGASDWHTTAWLDGQRLGEHQGGYTPFSFELSGQRRRGTQRLVLRVDDAPREFRLDGKQGYGNARGVWQTVWLEQRGDAVLARLHFQPDLAGSKVKVRARLLEPAPSRLPLELRFLSGGLEPAQQAFEAGASDLEFDVPVASPRLWSLDEPFLYEVEARLGTGPGADVVKSYFGMREISVVDLPGTDIPWIALNGEPVYVQLALDQAYHPEGYYSFPDDAFVRDEVLRARQIGLNGLRVHVKVGLPRKLYWADRLGMLIMADVPNSWGEPGPEMRKEVEYALDQMIARDYNHPSIFAWVPFNETWGLYDRVEKPGAERPERVYSKATQEWVVSVVERARALDPTRLVEDNSVCCDIGHTVTDINSWHAYLPGWEWEKHLDEMSEMTYPGSSWNFEEGYVQAREPNINSEFGNVWGYQGSTGDVDWSWDYHLALNAFRRHPRIAGWLYTEHHDVVNEWNGYWRYDRSEKDTGMDALAPGMSLRDLHGDFYVAVGEPGALCVDASPGESVTVPLWASFLTAGAGLGEQLVLRARLWGWDALGRERSWWSGERAVEFEPWLSGPLPPLEIELPGEPGLAVLSVELVGAAGTE